MTWNRYLGVEIRFISLILLIADIVGIVLIPNVWVKVGLGYAGVLAIGACFVLGTLAAWEEDKRDAAELVSLRASQRRDVRGNIYPVLGRVHWHLNGLEGDLDITIVLVSSLVEDIGVREMKGVLQIYDVASHEFDFTDAPQRLTKAARTNEVRQTIRLPDVMRREIERKQENAAMVNGKLVIKMRTDSTDMLTFDPSDDDVLSLTLGKE